MALLFLMKKASFPVKIYKALKMGERADKVVFRLRKFFLNMLSLSYTLFQSD